MSFTAKQLSDHLFTGPDYDDPNYDDKYDEWEAECDEFFYGSGNLGDFGNFKSVARWSYGDGQEQGVVFQHESGRYFKVTGYYSSWDSSTWDELHEVEPYEVVKIRYRKVNKNDD